MTIRVKLLVESKTSPYSNPSNVLPPPGPWVWPGWAVAVVFVGFGSGDDDGGGVFGARLY